MNRRYIQANPVRRTPTPATGVTRLSILNPHPASSRLSPVILQSSLNSAWKLKSQNIVIHHNIADRYKLFNYKKTSVRIPSPIRPTVKNSSIEVVKPVKIEPVRSIIRRTIPTNLPSGISFQSTFNEEATEADFGNALLALEGPKRVKLANPISSIVPVSLRSPLVSTITPISTCAV